MISRKTFYSTLILCLGLVSPCAADEARFLALLQKSVASYEKVKDYTAIFHKTETDEGKTGPEEIIFLKFEKPFKIFMGWLNTKKKGLQVLYERGRHDGKLVIHKPGLLLGLAPVIFLDQNSPWVKEGSATYDIEDAGIGTFLKDFDRAVTAAKKQEKLTVTALQKTDAGEEFGVTFEDSAKDPVYFAYRIKVLFDAHNHLPVRMELFDWENQPTGIYFYDNLLLNVGSDDPEFKKQINRRLAKAYAVPDR